MNILHHRRQGDFKTYLYANGKYSCNCQEYKDNQTGHCEHSRALNKDRVQAQSDEVRIYQSEVLRGAK